MAVKPRTDSPAPRSLTPKQEGFVAEFLIDLNATQAAIRAGYSKRTARQAGARLLSHVDIKAAVARARTERCERIKVDADVVLHELSVLAQANILDYVIPQDDGTLKLDLSRLTRDQAAGIAEIAVDELPGGTQRVKVKLIDKIRALALLGKHTDVRAFEDSLAITSGDSIAEYMERLDRREREREEARRTNARQAS